MNTDFTGRHKQGRAENGSAHSSTNGQANATPVDLSARVFVLRNLVLSFSEEVSGDNTAAVLKTCLLAALATEKGIEPNAGPTQWINSFVDIMKKIGWATQASGFHRRSERIESATLDKAFIAALEAQQQTGDTTIFETLIKTLGRLPRNDRRLAPLVASNVPDSGHVLQLAHITQIGRAPEMELAAFALSGYALPWGAAPDGDGLALRCETGTLELTMQTLSLDPEVYARIASTIDTKLAGSFDATHVQTLESA